jgi:predicted nucleic acid-binding protein
MPLLVDTGIVYALADRSDAWHAKARTYVESAKETLLAPVTIVPEVAYLLRDRIGADAEWTFLRSIVDGELAVENLADVDWKRADTLMGSYDWLGLVDATVVAVAERLKLRVVATTDRRHFGAVRPRHIAAFALVP